MSQSGLELAQQIGQLLSERALTLATAESCTGGMIGHTITQVAGSSAYFMGGVIAYANRIKVDVLKVHADALDAHGAVSEVVARQMADGVRALYEVDIGLGITGIMGPEGGTAEKPVGLAYVGISRASGCLVARLQHEGERAQIKELSCCAALRMLRNALIEKGE